MSSFPEDEVIMVSSGPDSEDGNISDEVKILGEGRRSHKSGMLLRSDKKPRGDRRKAREVIDLGAGSENEDYNVIDLVVVKESLGIDLARKKSSRTGAGSGGVDDHDNDKVVVVLLDDNDDDSEVGKKKPESATPVIDVSGSPGQGRIAQDLGHATRPDLVNLVEEGEAGADMMEEEPLPFKTDEGPSTSPDYVVHSEELLKEFGIEFAQCERPPATKTDIEKATSKMMEMFDELRDMALHVHAGLQDEIKMSIDELKLSPKDYWKIFRSLLDKMAPQEIVELAEIRQDDRKRAREAEKRALIQEAEQQLRLLADNIRMYSEMEVDLDDEKNSPFILLDNAKKIWIEAYYGLCNILGYSPSTNLRSQKKIKLARHDTSSNYEDIDRALEALVNEAEGGYLFRMPRFRKVLKVVEDVNKSKQLGLIPKAENDLAEKMFKDLVHIISKGRRKDFKMSMLDKLPSSGGGEEQPAAEKAKAVAGDPAEHDPELMRKLKENIALRKSETEVLDHFAKMAKDEEVKLKESSRGSDGELMETSETSAPALKRMKKSDEKPTSTVAEVTSASKDGVEMI